MNSTQRKRFDMVLMIAEIASNWNGNYAILDHMVYRCKLAGMDCIKFQALSKELILRHPELSWYSSASITVENVDKVDTICRHYDIEWFCTPTYPNAVKFLDPLVIKWKIRHADNQRKDIIDACLATDKPVYISVSRPDDIDYKDKNIHKIYCIPKYPTDFGELNFDMIRQVEGYSNHCLDPLAVLRAIRYKAKYVEFHITSNIGSFTIDNKVSFTLEQMKEIMKWVRESSYKQD